MNNQHNNFENNNDNTGKVNSGFASSAPTSEELDSIEYILPVAKKKKSHKKASHSNSPKQTKDNAIDDFVYAQPYNKKHAKKKKGLKIFGIIMGVIAALLVICVSTILIFNQVGKSSMHNYDELNIEPPVEQIDKIETVENDGKTIKYNGHTYSFNEKVTSVVLMGIDIDEKEMLLDTEIGAAGQADAIYIAVIDTTKNKVTILGVSRDAMTDVNVYNKSGGFVNTQFLQICLSYAYGDGEHTSCQNTITSLERLFYGMQFDTYFSMDIPAIETLTDAVGGVTLTVQSDFKSNYYGRTIPKGETITLYGDDAISYIRSRNIAELDSNNDRMARQKQFMTAFLAQCFDSIKSNPSTVVDLYKTVDDNSSTNLNASKMTYLASTAISGLDSYKEIEFINVPGTIKKGEYAEFYADQNALMDIMLDLFYVQVQ